MTETDYEKILENAKRDLFVEQRALGECEKQIEGHEKKITGLRATIAALSRMLDKEFIEEDAIGLTDAIRECFKTVGNTGLTPAEVKGRLEMMGYDITKYGNVMASVHTIVTRLQTKGEIRQVGTRAGDNKPVYQWVQRLEPPPTTK